MMRRNQQVKQLFFLVALPRSGNTLFGSIMNQNPNIAVTPNSITLEIMKDLFLLKQTDVFQNYPDHKSLDNVLDIVFDNYYKAANYASQQCFGQDAYAIEEEE